MNTENSMMFVPIVPKPAGNIKRQISPSTQPTRRKSSTRKSTYNKHHLNRVRWSNELSMRMATFALNEYRKGCFERPTITSFCERLKDSSDQFADYQITQIKSAYYQLIKKFQTAKVWAAENESLRKHDPTEFARTLKSYSVCYSVLINIPLIPDKKICLQAFDDTNEDNEHIMPDDNYMDHNNYSFDNETSNSFQDSDDSNRLHDDAEAIRVFEPETDLQEFPISNTESFDRERLEFDRKRHEDKMQLERDKMELEKEKMAADKEKLRTEEKRAQRDFELRKLELEYNHKKLLFDISRASGTNGF